MKKIIVIVIVIAAAGGLIYSAKNLFQSAEQNVPVPPSPADLMNDHEEEMASSPNPAPPAANPTPPSINPNPQSVPDEIEDVDVAPPKVFNITGRNFSFSQSEIRVKKGDRVVINFESTDGLHDWVVDEFGAQTERVNPGTKTSVEFIADKTGTFEYYCSVSIHRAAGMKGSLIVE